MSSSLAANASRQTAVLAAILGIHIGAFILAGLGLGPQRWMQPPPAAITLLQEPIEPAMPVRPDAFRAGGYELPVQPEPDLDIPRIQDPMPDASGGRESATVRMDGGPATAATLDRSAAPRMRGGSVAALVGACYPSASRRLGEEGRVVVRVVIGASGRPARWAVDQSSGFPRLDAAANNCVIRRLEFVAGQRDGRALEAVVLLPVVFRLD